MMDTVKCDILFSLYPLQVTNTPTTTQLAIPEVFAEDTGNYSVILRNPAGQACSKARLTVELPPPEPTGSSPKFISPLMHPAAVKVGEPVTFECQVRFARMIKIDQHYLAYSLALAFMIDPILSDCLSIFKLFLTDSHAHRSPVSRHLRCTGSVEVLDCRPQILVMFAFSMPHPITRW